MRLPIIAFVLGLFSLSCPAQMVDNSPVKGSFYVSVDDACTIFVNGVKVFQCGLGEKRSPEMELKVGDRIVVQLRNDTSGRRFMLVFGTVDAPRVINFKHTNFKIVPDLDVKDFTDIQFAGYSKQAKEDKGMKYMLPIKSTSEYIWGDMDSCILAGYVTTQMISRRY